MPKHLHLVAPSEDLRLLRVDVYRKLRDDILSCRLAPGQELREAELAEQFGVSKSPIRDALFQLAQEGLVRIRPRQGYLVTPVSVRDVRDMFAFRAVLEGAAMQMIAATASDAELAGLDRYRSFDPDDYPGGFIRYNREFHAVLAGLCGNARLKQSSQSLIEQMDRVVHISVHSVRRRDTSKLVAQHAAIIDALQARDAKRAERLARRHVDEAQRRVCSALTQLVE